MLLLLGVYYPILHPLDQETDSICFVHFVLQVSAFNAMPGEASQGMEDFRADLLVVDSDCCL